MGTFSVRGRVVVTSSCLIVWGALYACTVEEENPATGGRRGVDSGLGSSGNTADGSQASTGAPICGKYGGYDKVKQLAGQIIDSAKADCRIARIVNGATDNATKLAHFMDCFYVFVGGSFQCPGISYSQNTTADSKNQKCQSIVPGLEFSAKDWEAFADANVNPASAARKVFENAGLTKEELTSIAAAFNDKKIGLLNENVAADKHTLCEAACASGGQACVPAIIDSGADVKDTSTGSPDTGSPDTGPDTGP
jgi:hypothetical protein